MMDSVTSSPRRAVVKSFLLTNISGRHLQTQTEVQGGWVGTAGWKQHWSARAAKRASSKALPRLTLSQAKRSSVDNEIFPESSSIRMKVWGCG